jgi:hypothetical protein
MTEEKREKRVWIDDWQKKEGAFFRQGVLREVYGKRSNEEREE